jgi:hypothetical protein
VKTTLVLVAMLLPVPLAAQGLGDTAARERRKRQEKKAAAPAKVFTNQDLPAPSSSGPEEAGPEGPAASSKGAEAAAVPAAPVEPSDPSEKEREERRLLEAEWRVRFANAREQLAVAEVHSWQEVVRTEFYQGIPVQMKIKEQVETEELKQARRALADLEEEFRRTGLPPGWARER